MKILEKSRIYTLGMQNAKKTHKKLFFDYCKKQEALLTKNFRKKCDYLVYVSLEDTIEREIFEILQKQKNIKIFTLKEFIFEFII